MRSLRRKTLLFAFLAAMLMCVFTILLSFSFAEDGDTREAKVLPTSSSNYVSNIDLIIENSHSGSDDGAGKDLSMFYIVEVGSKDYSFTGNDVSPLYKMLIGDISSSNVKKVDENDSKEYSTFARFVVDMHSSKYESLKTFDSIENLLQSSKLSDTDVMVKDKFVYTYYYVGGGIDEKTCVEDLAKADFVYLSDPPSAPFSDTYDLPESVKIQLSSVASSKYVPFIIDDYTKAGQSSGSNAKNFSTLKTRVFKVYGSQRYTVDMDTSIDIDKYLNRKSGGSLYLPIIKNSTDNWVASTEGGDKDTARFLVIRQAASDNAVTSKFISAQSGLNISGKVVDPDNSNIETYPVDPDGPMYQYGYSGTNRPKFIQFEMMNLNSDSTPLSSKNFSDYDMIIIEKGVSSVELSNDLYNTFSSLVFGNAHIIYDKSLPDGEKKKDKTVNTPPNYKYVYDKVATSAGRSRFSNVLISTYDDMEVYAASVTASGVEDIVDILKGGMYRGNGGNDNLSNTYNVLEIQPAYPIDVKLAEYLHSGNFETVTENYSKRSGSNISKQAPEKDEWYYIRTDAVSHETADQISFDGTHSLATMMFNDTTMRSVVQSDNFANVTDYFAWELSDAKIAHLTGRPMDTVNVTHMSALEFNTNRDTLKDTFDLIYIGGNDSSLRFGKTYYKLGNGYMVGNDFSDIRLEDLEEYRDAGLPIVLSNDLVTGTKVIDADTNVAKFIAESATKAFSIDINDNAKGNVLYGFDPTDTVLIPNDGSYGQTYGGMVTVLNGIDSLIYQYDPAVDSFSLKDLLVPDQQPDNGYMLKKLIDNTNSRPKFILTEHPLLYQEGNNATNINNSQGLKFVFKITDGGSYEPHLYVDDNHNSQFDPDTEEFDIDYDESTNTVTCDLPSDSYGGLYWKFSLKDPDSELETAVVGLSKIVADEKGTVNLLQLVSWKPFKNPEKSKNGCDTLFFCTDCQQCKMELHGVRYTNEGKYGAPAAYQSANFQDFRFSTDGLDGLTNPIGSTIAGKDRHYKYTGNKLGVHIHNFGIVKYDNNHTIAGWTGLDNWESNWADELLDDYDFNTKILTLEEFDDQVKSGINARNAAPDVTLNNGADKDDIYNRVYSYIGQNYKNYYETFDDYYIDGKYYRSSNGKYYNINSGSAREMDVANGSDEDKNNASAVDVIIQKLCTGYSLYDQYMEDFENDNFDNYSGDVKVNVTTSSNPGGDISEADLKRVFEYCEYNRGDIGITVNDMNKYVVAQYNLDKFLAGYRSFIEQHPGYELANNADTQHLLDEIDYETKYHRYGDMFSVAVYGNSNLQNTTTPAFTFEKASIDNTTGKYNPKVKVNISSASDFRRIYAELYSDWRDAKIIEQYLRDYYIEYMINSGYKNGSIDLTKAYSCVVIGAAENMADDDLKSDDSLNALKNYIDNGGHTILFHETISASNASPRLCTLRSRFGLELGADDSQNQSQDQMSEEDLLDQNSNCKIPQSSGNTTLTVGGYHTGEGQTSYNRLTDFTIPGNTKSADVTIKTWGSGKNASVSVDNVVTGATSTGQTYINIKILAGWNNEAEATNDPFSDNQRYGIDKFAVFTGGVNGTIVFDIADAASGSGSGGGAAGQGLTQWGYASPAGREWDLVTSEYMNKFASALYSDAGVPNYDTAFNHELFVKKTFTDRANRVNKGVVTAYPFMIDENLKISGTHPGSLAANIYSKDMVVWYTFDGGSPGTLSSPAAADPHNGADNYYMYSYKNVMYCGAGHSNITGKRINNNDERRLFINAIINGAGPSFKGPSISVYDYVGPENDNKQNQTYSNDDIKPDGTDYKMTVTSTTSNPNFTYRAKTDSTQDITEVKIYYDLTPTNPTSGVDKFKFVQGQDVLIYNMKYKANGSDEEKSIANKLYKSINNSVAGKGHGVLTLKPNYFMYDGNTTAYIIIAVRTSNDRYAFKRIKVKLTPKMYDLT